MGLRAVTGSSLSLVSSLPGVTMEDTLRSLDFDLTHIGINVTETFERLLSPAGVLNQYALSIILQTMTIIGFITAG